MIIFDAIAAARDSITVYCASEEDAAIIAEVEAFNVLPSPVDQIVRTGEYLFAQRAGISDAGKAQIGRAHV